MYFFGYHREVQTVKNLLLDMIFAVKIFFQMTFSKLPPIGLRYTKMGCSIHLALANYSGDKTLLELLACIISIVSSVGCFLHR
jgi:hypothetical protein